ncbi:MAG: hypothetical protein AB7C97_09365 [Oscillospiraceae bacterium]
MTTIIIELKPAGYLHFLYYLGILLGAIVLNINKIIARDIITVNRENKQLTESLQIKTSELETALEKIPCRYAGRFSE